MELLFATSQWGVFPWKVEAAQESVECCSWNPLGGSIAQHNTMGELASLQTTARSSLWSPLLIENQLLRNVIERLPSAWKGSFMQRCSTHVPEPPTALVPTSNLSHLGSSVTCCVRWLHELYAFSTKGWGSCGVRGDIHSHKPRQCSIIQNYFACMC